MPRVIAALIRHGDYAQLPDTPSAHQPFPLTADGERQAREAAASIRDACTRNGWQLEADIDSSRMLRAWQTARIIAFELADLAPSGLTVTSFDTLAERSVGAVANLSLTQIEEVIHRDPRFPDLPEDWKSDSHYRLPLQGAESLVEAGERVAAHLQACAAGLAVTPDVPRLKLFVGHGAAMRHAAWHLGVLEFTQIAQLSMYHGRPVYIECRPDGSWHHAGGDWKVRLQDNAAPD
ncbi:MAG TPA: histidine phosphatase family protein [Gammaproteobacteria bacterium]|nr:histidine phosphatase family protein [Gammaproteobacteria bacterium]